MSLCGEKNRGKLKQNTLNKFERVLHVVGEAPNWIILTLLYCLVNFESFIKILEANVSFASRYPSVHAVETNIRLSCPWGACGEGNDFPSVCSRSKVQSRQNVDPDTVPPLASCFTWQAWGSAQTGGSNSLLKHYLIAATSPFIYCLQMLSNMLLGEEAVGLWGCLDIYSIPHTLPYKRVASGKLLP